MLSEILGQNEAALIRDDDNRFYFTGLRCSAGALLVTKNDALLLVDFRYFEKAKQQVKVAEVLLCERFYSQLEELLKKNDIDTLFVETDTISLSDYCELRNALSSIKVSDSNILSKQMRKLRSVKTKEEEECIIRAQKLTDETFSYILNKIKPGATEKQIMLDMEFYMRSLGSEGVAFDFIVVSGENSSLPHGVPSDRVIQNGDFVTMDFGAVIGGYRSDMTRTVAVGHISDKQREVYDTVLVAQTVAIKAIKPGIKCCEVDKIARDIIAEAGFGGCFGHGLGHSVGLAIHESPACNRADETPLEAGMVMTVEPGIYIENEFGVRIEDMVILTESSCKNLTKSPKELIILS